MSNQAYSPLKAAWHTERIEAMRRGDQVAPVQVHFIISDLCNQDCSFCAYRMSEGFTTEQFGEDTGKGFTMNPNRKIPTEKAIEILGDMANLGVQGVQFTGGGEPTVHPDHLRLFAYAQRLGMKTALVTNGYILKDGWEDTYKRMAWIRVSLDAGSAATYSKVRRVPEGAFGRTISNIALISRALEGTDCLLGVGYVVTPDNYRELVGACTLLRGLGVPYVRLTGVFSKRGSEYYDGVYDEIRREIRKTKRVEQNGFRIVDLFGTRIEDLDSASPSHAFCGYQQLCMYIGADQKVYRCCTTSYTLHGQVGDLRDRRLADWFRSDEKRAAYGGFDARSCQVCQFNDKNRVIRYLVEGRPLHVEFV